MKSVDGTKRCFDCGQTKQTNEFGNSKNASDKLNPLCRACNSRRVKEWRQGVRRRDVTPEGLIRSRAREEFSDKKSAHGIGVRDFWDLWEWQDGICPFCEEPLDGNGGYVIDHEGGKQTFGDWTKVRGIVHQKCNNRISDNTVRTAKKMVSYLELPPAQTLYTLGLHYDKPPLNTLLTQKKGASPL